MVRILSTLITADGGEARVAGYDVRTEPDGVRRSIGVTGQFSAIDELLTGRENLRLMADLAHLLAEPRPRPGRRAAGPVRPVGRRRPPRRDVLRRHEAPPRPRDDAGQPAAGDLPRRADHRARPAQPPRPVADRPRAARRRRDDLPDDAVPRGGRPARPHGRPARRRPTGREGTPAELKAQAGGETLDDVFLALTGHAATTDDSQDEETRDEHHDVRRPRLDHDAAAQPQAPGPLPVADGDDHRDAGGLPAAVRLRLRRHHGRRAARRSAAATRGPTTCTTSPRRSW